MNLSPAPTLKDPAVFFTRYRELFQDLARQEMCRFGERARAGRLDRDELVNEAFLVLLRLLRKKRGNFDLEKLVPWVCTRARWVMHHVALDNTWGMSRSNYLRLRRIHGGELPSREDICTFDMEQPARGPATTDGSDQLIAALIGVLPGMGRYRVRLFLEKGGDLKATARALGIRLESLQVWLRNCRSTIQNRLNRVPELARARLAELLADPMPQSDRAGSR